MERALNIKFGYPVICKPWCLFKYLIYACVLTCLINIVFTFGMLVAAVRIVISYSRYMNMVCDEGNFLPSVLAVPAATCLPLNASAMVVLYKSMNKRKRKALNLVMFVIDMVILAVTILLLCFSLMAVIHSNSKKEKLHDGITDAMRNYARDSDLKYQIDLLQIRYQCCGSKTYKEWFGIAWFDTSLEHIDRNPNSAIVQDDVPFSCCSMKNSHLCIHHQMTATGQVYRHTAEQISVSQVGCHTVLIYATKVLGGKIALTLFGFTFLQGLVGIGLRFVQTGHSEKYRFDRNSYWHTAWLFGCYTGKKKKRAPPLPPIPEELMNE